MSHFTDLRVFQQARQNLKDIAHICNRIQQFGDIKNQAQRSAISVVSNIAEGAGNNSNKQFIHFLGIARGSNNELLTQIIILKDLNHKHINDELINNINHTGKMLTKLIEYLKHT